MPDPSPFNAEYLDHNIPRRLHGSSFWAFRVVVKNTGSMTWNEQGPNSVCVSMLVSINGEFKTSGWPLRTKVCPGEKTFICFKLDMPDQSGVHRLQCDLLAHNISVFSKLGVAPLIVDVEVCEHEKTESEHLWETAAENNYWFFSPGLGVHLSDQSPVYPLFAKSAVGSRIVDVEGREFVDLIMGWGCSLLGYANERIKNAIRDSLSSGGVITLTHTLEMDVSRMLCEMIPSGENVLFGKNGSDVCTAAIRMARAYTQRKKVLICGYHGWQDWNAEQYGFAATSVPEREDNLVFTFPYLDLPKLKELLSLYSDDVAAVIIDPSSPVFSLNGPIPEVDTNFLNGVASHTRRAGAVLIFDEILSAFRYRQGSVQKAHGVTPDLTCVGKALSAGMPLSALVGKREIFRSALPRIYYTPTFKGEVYSFAAAREALRIYQCEDIPAHIWEFGERLKKRINSICKEIGLPAKVIGQPFRMTMSFQEKDYEKNIMMRTLLVQELTRNSVITWKGLMLPCYAHSNRDLKDVIIAFEKALPVIYSVWKSDLYLKHLEIPDDP